MSLTADLARWQRRIRPEKRRAPLGYRDRSALPFFPAATLAGPVMLDTCAYIDALSGTMPLALQALLPGRRHLHSTVCLAELAFGLGAIKPDAAHAARSRSTLRDLFDRIEIKRTVSLSASGWMAAGLIAGVLGRLQGGGSAERRRFLTDAAIYLSARTAGATLLTANWRDFDLIDRLVVDGQAGGRLLCYTPEPSQAGGS
ncbi:MAG: type II toxin-antitoxin system VapC family toxin [Rhodospirillaceae bacterium]|nr:type II toxin-antitoxin system VapC family toxin [Rhodospirillaceae bacterium]MYB14273.1 type II toxin-antitoxin system VapC family toxin [Rhodospirillaceae bacterium]MYI48359.1 type II toxin-antitoxin system VapC family toxin [Rhodospirillaceae bacterium]